VTLASLTVRPLQLWKQCGQPLKSEKYGRAKMTGTSLCEWVRRISEKSKTSWSSNNNNQNLALLLFLFGSKNPVTMEAHAKDKESNEEDNAAVVADEAVGEEE
jgi:hypothetical protein